ncbi:MAG: hypothetical protein ACREA9_12410 [Pyrinomonadaceae bacterium]
MSEHAPLLMKYFVLKPKGTDIYAEASRAAMKAYAKKIEHDNPTLAYELASWAVREELYAKGEV